MLVVALPHYEFIRVSGADTVTFLQGQVSCDVTALTPERSPGWSFVQSEGRVILQIFVFAAPGRLPAANLFRHGAYYSRRPEQVRVFSKD